jgi:hypothetical protein
MIEGARQAGTMAGAKLSSLSLIESLLVRVEGGRCYVRHKLYCMYV